MQLFIKPRKCIYHPDPFCYVCGKFTSNDQHRNTTWNIKKIYMVYFGCSLGDHNKAPIEYAIKTG